MSKTRACWWPAVGPLALGAAVAWHASMHAPPGSGRPGEPARKPNNEASLENSVTHTVRDYCRVLATAAIHHDTSRLRMANQVAVVVVAM